MNKQKLENLPDIISVKDLKNLGFSHVTAYEIVHTEGFPKIQLKPGGRIYIPKSQFIKWLETQAGGTS